MLFRQRCGAGMTIVFEAALGQSNGELTIWVEAVGKAVPGEIVLVDAGDGEEHKACDAGRCGKDLLAVSRIDQLERSCMDFDAAPSYREAAPPKLELSFPSSSSGVQLIYASALFSNSALLRVQSSVYCVYRRRLNIVESIILRLKSASRK